MALILSGTDGLSDVDGSAATPAIRGTDTNTGIYFPAADTIAFSEGGVESMRINSSGDLGIGTISPKNYANYKTITLSGTNGGIFDFTDSVNNVVSEIVGDSTGLTLSGASAAMLFRAGGSERMRITSAGNVGIGTSSPSTKFHVYESAAASVIATVEAGTDLFRALAQFKAKTTGSVATSLTLGAYGDAGDVQQIIATGQLVLRSGTSQPIVFQTGGSTERMRLDSSGNLGLGGNPSAITSGGKYLQVSSFTSFGQQSNGSANMTHNAFESGANAFSYVTSAAAGRYNITQNSHQWFVAPSGTAGNAITFTQAMTLDASGNLTLGTTSGAKRLNVYAAADNPLRLMQDHGTASAYGIEFYTYRGASPYVVSSVQASHGAGYANPYFVINVADTSAVLQERMRIDTSGNLLVGTTSRPQDGGIGFSVVAGGSGTSLQNRISTTADFGQFLFYNPNGQVGAIRTNGSATSYLTSSDYRLKENIAPMTGALAKVSQLKPVTYKWKVDGSDGQGFIAHELQEVVADAVVGEKDAVNEDGSINPQGIDTSFLVATLTAAIQEQQAIINDLTTRLTALENK